MLRISSLFLPLLLLSLAAPARADDLPDGMREVDYSFEIENLEEFPDSLIVAFPFHCSSYEVLRNGKAYPVSSLCPTSDLYALPTREFATKVVDAAGRPGPRDKGEQVRIINYLENRTVPERTQFFKKDRWVFPMSYRLRPLFLLGGRSTLKQIHDVLRVERQGTAKGKLALRAIKVVFTYSNGSVEDQPYASELRPRPQRKDALDELDDEGPWEPALPPAMAEAREEIAPPRQALAPAPPARAVLEDVPPASIALYIALLAMALTCAIALAIRRA